MNLWLRIALVVALAILLWILIVDFAEDVDDAKGGFESSAADPAARCAEFVRSYRNLEGRIEVVGAPTESAEGSVEIGWRGTEPGNLPAEGRAECTFAVGAGGRLSLVEASVDGIPVDEAAIESQRQSAANR